MTYSIDFRKQVLSHIDSGASIETTSKLFSIGTTTIKNWKRLKAETGQLSGSGRPPTPYKIDSDKLKVYVKEHPDAFLNEIAIHFNVTGPAIHAALKRLKITRKKSPHYIKSDAKKSDADT
jgi:transposase